MIQKKRPELYVVIPAFNVQKQIKLVLDGIPDYISRIIIVNDCSTDATREVVLESVDERVHLLTHTKNKGVGGAMMTGYGYALSQGADIVVKVDGDGQMNPDYISDLLDPITKGKADYSKGNRFLHPVELRRMPLLRRIGNLGLTFLTKITSGYWNIFDPTNGFTAIASDKLGLLEAGKIARDYFFETSMLCELRKWKAVVVDVPIPAIYGGESSSIRIIREFFVFSRNLLRSFFRRVYYQYFLYDFSVASFYLMSGGLLGLFGMVWGLFQWAHSIQTGIPATSGTVLIAVLPVILAVQFILQAIALDISSSPTKVDKSFRYSKPTDLSFPNLVMHFKTQQESGLVIIERGRRKNL